MTLRGRSSEENDAVEKQLPRIVVASDEADRADRRVLYVGEAGVGGYVVLVVE